MSLPTAHDDCPLGEEHDPDGALLAGLRAGDERAFVDLFRAYHAGLCSFVYDRVRSAAVAEDLVMDVFRRLWEHRAALRIERSLRSYLFSAAEHAAASHLRHRQVETTLVRDVTAHVRSAPAVAAAQPTPAMDVERAELAEAIARAAEALSPRRRAVFLLWQQQFAYAEIAHVLGVSLKIVEHELGRALRTLRTRLSAFRD